MKEMTVAIVISNLRRQNALYSQRDVEHTHC